MAKDDNSYKNTGQMPDGLSVRGVCIERRFRGEMFQRCDCDNRTSKSAFLLVDTRTQN